MEYEYFSSVWWFWMILHSQPCKGRVSYSSIAWALGSKIMDDDAFKLRFVGAFKYLKVMKQLQLARNSLIDPLARSIQQLMNLKTNAGQELVDRDHIISRLSSELEDKKNKYDELEQQWRGGSVQAETSVEAANDDRHQKQSSCGPIIHLASHRTQGRLMRTSIKPRNSSIEHSNVTFAKISSRMVWQNDVRMYSTKPDNQNVTTQYHKLDTWLFDIFI